MIIPFRRPGRTRPARRDMPDLNHDRALDRLLEFREALPADEFVLDVMHRVQREQRSRKLILAIFGLVGAAFGVAGALLLSDPIARFFTNLPADRHHAGRADRRRRGGVLWLVHERGHQPRHLAGRLTPRRSTEPHRSRRGPPSAGAPSGLTIGAIIETSMRRFLLIALSLLIALFAVGAGVALVPAARRSLSEVPAECFRAGTNRPRTRPWTVR